MNQPVEPTAQPRPAMWCTRPGCEHFGIPTDNLRCTSCRYSTGSIPDGVDLSATQEAICCPEPSCARYQRPTSDAFCGECGTRTHAVTTARPIAQPAPTYQPPPIQPIGTAASGRTFAHPASPGLLATIAVTLFFGVFGAIVAYLHTAKAAGLGDRTNRYWKAFGWTMAASVVAWVLVVVVFIVALAGATSSSTTSSSFPGSAPVAVEPSTAPAPAAPVTATNHGLNISQAESADDPFGEPCATVVSHVTTAMGSPTEQDTEYAHIYTFDNYLDVFCPLASDAFTGWTYYSLTSPPTTPTVQVATSDGYRLGQDGSGIDVLESDPSEDGSINYDLTDSGITYLVQTSDSTIAGFKAGVFK
jgi:disulfide bond formation protein DsbB